MYVYDDDYPIIISNYDYAEFPENKHADIIMI